MAGENPREAVDNFLKPLQDAVLCVTDAYVNPQGGYHARPDPPVVVLNKDEPVPLRGRSDLTLQIYHHYRIVQDKRRELGPWKVSTAGYIYLVRQGEQQILGYHWHPHPEWDIHFPHLHVYALERLERPDLVKAHYPTGRVSFESVLRFLIREFGVNAKDNHAAILDRTEAAFLKYRTWG